MVQAHLSLHKRKIGLLIIGLGNTIKMIACRSLPIVASDPLGLCNATMDLDRTENWNILHCHVPAARNPTA
jgi:hypothetical protein